MVALGNAGKGVCACMLMSVWEAYIYVIASHCAVAKNSNGKQLLKIDHINIFKNHYFLDIVNKCQIVLIDRMAKVVLHFVNSVKF